MTAAKANFIELLRDGRGVYGVGVAGPHGPLGRDMPWPLILRPDRFDVPTNGGAVLQKINDQYRRFRFSLEDDLRAFIHKEWVQRAGLTWPPRRVWSPAELRTYHGRRASSFRVINSLISQALADAADPDALKAARRFTLQHRELIYRACAVSRRALQLVDTFPLLALAIYTSWRLPCMEVAVGSDDDWLSKEEAALDARKKAAANLVERGVRPARRGCRHERADGNAPH